jgi:hypothetical protein
MYTAARISKANPTAGDVHVNRPLTTISTSFTQDAAAFVAGKVFPKVDVANQSDLYERYSKGTWMVGGAQKRGPAAESAGGGYDVDTDSFRCDVWALHSDVDDHARANAAGSSLQPDQDATEWVTENMMITREVEWASKFFAQSVWTTEQEGVASGPTGTQFVQWDAASNSAPIADIRAAKAVMLELTGREPNTLVLDPYTWNGLQDNAEIVDRIGTGATIAAPALVTLQLVAQILELDNVFVAKGVRNTAQEGATVSTSFIMAKAALLLYVAPRPGLKQPSAGYTFAWTGLLGSGAEGTRIKKIRLEKEGADRIEGESAYDQKVVSADLGHFFYTAVS